MCMASLIFNWKLVEAKSTVYNSLLNKGSDNFQKLLGAAVFKFPGQTSQFIPFTLISFLAWIISLFWFLPSSLNILVTFSHCYIYFSHICTTDGGWCLIRNMFCLQKYFSIISIYQIENIIYSMFLFNWTMRSRLFWGDSLRLYQLYMFYRLMEILSYM